MGALALTSKAAYREPFEPLPGDVTFVPYGDAEALAAAVTDETAAVVLEPIQGEAGVVVPPEGYLAAARAIADEHGALLWLDEVQTGIGRTGAWFAHHAAGVAPRRRHRRQGPRRRHPDRRLHRRSATPATLLEPGNHGTTFGGNPVACAAALAVLGTIEDDGLLEHVTVLGQKLRDGLAADPRVTEVRGEGLLIGLDLAADDVRRGRRGRPATPASSSTTRPRRDPARAAAGPHRGRRRRVPRRLAGHPRRGDGGSAVMTRHFLRDDDLTPAEQAEVLDLAAELKHAPYDAQAARRPATVAMIFDKPTLRTQASFAAGIAELGGYPMLVDGAPRRHRRARVRRTTSPACSAGRRRHRLAHLRPGPTRGDGRARRRPGRQRAHRRLPPLPAARRPAHDPRAQGRARRADRRLRRRRRLQHGQLLAARRRHRRHARRVSSPEGYVPDPQMVDEAAAIAATTGGSVAARARPGRRGRRRRRRRHRHLGVDGQGGRGGGPRRGLRAVLAVTDRRCSRSAKPDAIVMHCLPAYRGKEIDAEVIDGPQSVVWDEAENRRHAQKAMLDLPRWRTSR